MTDSGGYLRQPDCDGSYTCKAATHLHGCYSDDPCEHPEERGFDTGEGSIYRAVDLIPLDESELDAW